MCLPTLAASFVVGGELVVVRGGVGGAVATVVVYGVGVAAAAVGSRSTFVGQITSADARAATPSLARFCGVCWSSQSRLNLCHLGSNIGCCCSCCTLAICLSVCLSVCLSPAQYLSKAGVPTILCNGETAEFTSLTTDERRLLVEFAREAFSGKRVGGRICPRLPVAAAVCVATKRNS